MPGARQKGKHLQHRSFFSAGTLVGMEISSSQIQVGQGIPKGYYCGVRYTHARAHTQTPNVSVPIRNIVSKCTAHYCAPPFSPEDDKFSEPLLAGGHFTDNPLVLPSYKTWCVVLPVQGGSIAPPAPPAPSAPAPESDSFVTYVIEKKSMREWRMAGPFLATNMCNICKYQGKHRKR